MIAKIFFGNMEETKENLIERVNPYTGKVVSKFPACTREDAERALEIAATAAKTARESTLNQRVLWLEDVAIKLNESKEDIAKTICDEVGKPITFARIEVDRAIETVRLSANAAMDLCGNTINTDAMPSGRKTLAYFRREPVGVVACITPFNFPLNLVAHKIAPALGAGNSVVLKPTPEAPLTAYKFTKLFIESDHAVQDALSVVYGDVEVGRALVSSHIPRVVSFTGSASVGETITKNAGIKKVGLELGGNAATYIDNNTDTQHAAQRCAFGAFINSGQVCISLQRIYVHEEIYEEFSAQIKSESEKLKVGSPFDDETFIGPMISNDSVERAKEWVESAMNEGATCLCGNRAEGLNFYPTVMAEVKDDMNIVCQEVFAPIVSLIKVKSYDEAIERMNNSPYGLQFSIFTNDLGLTQRFIDDADAGGVVVNDIPTLRFDIQPYGGIKQSGIGREGPRFAMEEFTDIKSVVIC